MSMKTLGAMALLVAVVAGAGVYRYLRGAPDSSPRQWPHLGASGQHPEGVSPAGGPGTGQFQSPASEAAGHARATRKAPAVEAVLFAGGGIRVDQANELIGSDKFAQLLSELEQQGAVDLEARELTTAYEGALREALVESGSVLELNTLACGLSVCGADFRGLADDEANFDAIMNAGRRSGARVYSAVTTIVPNGDGTYSYRVVFSTDPRARALRVPRIPGPFKPVQPEGGQ